MMTLTLKFQVYCASVFLLQSLSVGLEMAFTVIGVGHYDPEEAFDHVKSNNNTNAIVMDKEDLSWFGEMAFYS